MVLPSTYAMALFLAIISLVCWGSWANTYKLAKWRFELYYWDYALGALLAAVVAAFTFGSLGFDFGGGDGFVFLDDVMRSAKHSIAYALAAGAVFNLGNLLLVASVAVAGMSVAFLLAFGMALMLGVILDYILKPAGNPTMLFAAATLVAAAVVIGALAYRGLALIRAEQVIKSGKSKTMRPKAGWKGVVLALAGGLFLGVFSPLLDLSRAPDIGMGPYAAGVVFVAGIFISTFVFNLFFMNLPVRGEPVEILEYFRGTVRQHLFGLAGGVVWGIGAISFLVASSAISNGGAKLTAAPIPLLGPAVTTAVGWGAPLLAVLWGLVAWKEFHDGGSRERSLATIALVLFAAGLVLASIAPLYVG